MLYTCKYTGERESEREPISPEKKKSRYYIYFDVFTRDLYFMKLGVNVFILIVDKTYLYVLYYFLCIIKYCECEK